VFLIMSYRESFNYHLVKLEKWKNKVPTSLTEIFIFSHRVNEIMELFFHNSII